MEYLFSREKKFMGLDLSYILEHFTPKIYKEVATPSTKFFREMFGFYKTVNLFSLEIIAKYGSAIHNYSNNYEDFPSDFASAGSLDLVQ